MERLTSSAKTARRLRTDFLYKRCSSESLVCARRGSQPQSSWAPRSPSVLVPPPVVARVLAGAVDHVELLQRAPGADRDTGQRRLGQMAWHLGLVAQPLVEALQQRAATGQHDPTVHDVRGELRRGAVQGLLHGTDDLRQRLLERPADLL